MSQCFIDTMANDMQLLDILKAQCLYFIHITDICVDTKEVLCIVIKLR